MYDKRNKIENIYLMFPFLSCLPSHDIFFSCLFHFIQYDVLYFSCYAWLHIISWKKWHLFMIKSRFVWESFTFVPFSSAFITFVWFIKTKITSILIYIHLSLLVCSYMHVCRGFGYVWMFRKIIKTMMKSVVLLQC